MPVFPHIEHKSVLTAGAYYQEYLDGWLVGWLNLQPLSLNTRKSETS